MLIYNVELSRYSKTIPPTAISVAFYTLHFSERHDKVRIYTNSVLYKNIITLIRNNIITVYTHLL